jgi:hypothetical protein
MYFRCYGYFSFENEAAAKRNFEILTTRDDCRYFYFPDELSCENNTITFKTDGNFSAYRTCENTIDVVSEVAENAEFGNVKIDEGDGEDAMWSWRVFGVSDKQVYRTHTDPQKSYKFKGNLEFADEEIAKLACKIFLTDSVNSIFTKFPPHQRIFADDKKLIIFEGKFLHIDVHCAGNEKIFKKTEKLLRKIETQSVGGNLEIGETFALRFIPDSSENSSDWVNDMNRDIFYRYTGNLTFETAEEAENAWRKLLNDEKSLFKINAKNSFPLYIIGTKLIFDDIGGCRRKLFNDTNELLREVAAIAKSGKVEGAFSNSATMDSFVVDRTIPSKVRKSLKDSAAIAKRQDKC